MTYEDRYNSLRDSWENDELCFSEVNFSDEKKKESKKKDGEKSLEEKVNEIHKEMKKQKKKRRLKKILKGVGLGLITAGSIPLALKAKSKYGELKDKADDMGGWSRVFKDKDQWKAYEDAKAEAKKTLEENKINDDDDETDVEEKLAKRALARTKLHQAKTDNILKKSIREGVAKRAISDLKTQTDVTPDGETKEKLKKIVDAADKKEGSSSAKLGEAVKSSLDKDKVNKLKDTLGELKKARQEAYDYARPGTHWEWKDDGTWFGRYDLKKGEKRGQTVAEQAKDKLPLIFSQAKDPADDSPLEANPNTSDGKQVQATSNIKHKIDSRVRAIKDMQKESGLSKGEFIKKLMKDKQLQADYKDRVRSNN